MDSGLLPFISLVYLLFLTDECCFICTLIVRRLFKAVETFWIQCCESDIRKGLFWRTLSPLYNVLFVWKIVMYKTKFIGTLLLQRKYKDAVTFYSYLPKLMLCIPFCRRGKREAQSEVVNFMQANRQVKGYLCWFVVSVQTFYSCKIKCIKLRTFAIIQNKCEQKQMSHEIHLTGLRNQGQWENLSIHNCKVYIIL